MAHFTSGCFRLVFSLSRDCAQSLFPPGEVRYASPKPSILSFPSLTTGEVFFFFHVSISIGVTPPSVVPPLFRFNNSSSRENFGQRSRPKTSVESIVFPSSFEYGGLPSFSRLFPLPEPLCFLRALFDMLVISSYSHLRMSCGEISFPRSFIFRDLPSLSPPLSQQKISATLGVLFFDVSRREVYIRPVFFSFSMRDTPSPRL